MPPKNRTPAKWLKIALVVIVVFIAMFGLLFWIVTVATQGAVNVSNQLIADIQSDNAQAAYSLTSDGFKATTSYDETKQAIDKISPLLQGKTQIIDKGAEKRGTSHTQATVTYAIDSADGTKYLRVLLSNTNGTWQVLNFQSSDTLDGLDTSD